ncbi:MAG: DUF6502 family protein [Pseudomonadota bacterium]
MQDQTHNKISNALLIILRPLARILLNSGVGFKEFAELAKTAFVDVATQDYGIRGRPTNISRVAVMTGLTRKEVRRLRDKIDSGEPVSQLAVTPLARVLRRWFSEKPYIDKSGQPIPLGFDGDGITFTRLVREFGGDIPPGAMRTEFKRVGAVVQDDSGRLVPTRRIARPQEGEDRVATCLLHGVYPLLTTISHNLRREAGTDTWPQITAYSKPIRKSDAGRLFRISQDRLEEAAASFDDLFVAYESLYEAPLSDDEKDLSSIVVGMFYFEEHDEAKSYIWKS